ncbi:MAG: alpha-E domain-containing protein [Verrucomicrobiales bacterium]
MLCRVADSLFWMSRYIERAEDTARVVDVNIQLLLERYHSDPQMMENHWGRILDGFGERAVFETIYDEITTQYVAEYLTFSRKNPSSILSCIFAARENARMIRDQISSEMWEIINRLYLFLKGQDAERVLRAGVSEFFTQIKEFAHLFRGVTDATFPRQLGYEFIRAGCYLERAYKTVDILDSKHYLLEAGGKAGDGTALEVVEWVSVLRSCAGAEAYHRVYVSDVSRLNVVAFLVQSRAFPHSILFSLSQLQLALHSISGCPLSQFSNEAERLCGRAISQVLYTSAGEIVEEGFHDYLQGIKAAAEKIAIELGNSYMFFPIVDPVEDGDDEDGAEAELQEQGQGGVA